MESCSSPITEFSFIFEGTRERKINIRGCEALYASNERTFVRKSINPSLRANQTRKQVPKESIKASENEIFFGCRHQKTIVLYLYLKYVSNMDAPTWEKKETIFTRLLLSTVKFYWLSTKLMLAILRSVGYKTRSTDRIYFYVTNFPKSFTDFVWNIDD